MARLPPYSAGSLVASLPFVNRNPALGAEMDYRSIPIGPYIADIVILLFLIALPSFDFNFPDVARYSLFREISRI